MLVWLELLLRGTCCHWRRLLWSVRARAWCMSGWCSIGRPARERWWGLSNTYLRMIYMYFSFVIVQWIPYWVFILLEASCGAAAATQPLLVLATVSGSCKGWLARFDWFIIHYKRPWCIHICLHTINWTEHCPQGWLIVSFEAPCLPGLLLLTCQCDSRLLV